MDDFRRFFFRGLAALVPTLLTIAILIWAYTLLRDNVGIHINQALLALCQAISPQPRAWLVDEEPDALKYGKPIDEWNDEGRRLTIEYKVLHHKALRHPDPEVRDRAHEARNGALWQIAFAKYHLHLLGFLAAVILVYFTGFFLASFIGRASWRMAEGLLYRIPLIRAIYPNVKQVTDFLLSDRKVEFSGVVAVEYPRKGVWSIGLRTGRPLTQVQRRAVDELVTVFIPSSPTPVTGYVIQVPKADVVELNFTIDEALRFTISAGVISPEVVLPGATSDDPALVDRSG